MGKILGAIIGGVVGSFINFGVGTIVGAAVGYAVFPESKESEASQPTGNNGRGRHSNGRGRTSNRRSNTSSRRNSSSVNSFIGALTHIASVDGHFSADEQEYMLNLVNEFFPDITKEQLRQIILKAQKQPQKFTTYCQFLYMQFDGDQDALMALMESLCIMAIADGNLDDREIELLLQAERALHLPGYLDFFIDRLNQEDKNHSGMDLEECYRILECPRDATPAQIKAAWRKKCRQYHPDLLDGRGASSKEKSQAEQQMKMVNAAYDQLKEELNFQ